MTNEQAIKAWATRLSYEGQNANKSLFFIGDTIYSYSQRFKIATLNDSFEAFVTTKKVSSTTSKQTAMVRRELEKLNYKILDL